MAIDKLAGTNKWRRNEREVKLGNGDCKLNCVK
jgi:hypothetical protein